MIKIGSSYLSYKVAREYLSPTGSICHPQSLAFTYGFFTVFNVEPSDDDEISFSASALTALDI